MFHWNLVRPTIVGWNDRTKQTRTNPKIPKFRHRFSTISAITTKITSIQLKKKKHQQLKNLHFLCHLDCFQSKLMQNVFQSHPRNQSVVEHLCVWLCIDRCSTAIVIKLNCMLLLPKYSQQAKWLSIDQILVLLKCHPRQLTVHRVQQMAKIVRHLQNTKYVFSIIIPIAMIIGKNMEWIFTGGWNR